MSQKLESLSDEQLLVMEQTKKFWLDKFFSFERINEKVCREQIAWLYKFCDLKVPEIVFVESPLAAQKYANKVNDTNQFYEFSSYGNAGDLGWVSFYDFFTKIGVIDNKDFNEFQKLIATNVYEMIQFDELCIVSQPPVMIKKNDRGQLHNDEGPSIKFSDNYALYFWNSVNVPEKWIENRAGITKKEIHDESNAEKRRCIREIIGAQKYYELLGGVEVVDTDMDDQGNPMTLYRTVEVDEIINIKPQFLEVMCPSTKRVYNLYPTRHDCKNVWEAKASTFSDEKIQYRHGDVGLLNLKTKFEKPVMET